MTTGIAWQTGIGRTTNRPERAVASLQVRPQIRSESWNFVSEEAGVSNKAPNGRRPDSGQFRLRDRSAHIDNRTEEGTMAKSTCCGEPIEKDNNGRPRCSKCGAAQGK